MWKTILLVILVVAGAGAALVANRVKHAPPQQVERGTFVAAAPETIIAELARLQNWVGWFAQGKDDPTIRRVYGGPPSGAGASCYWFRNDRAVEGRLTIISVGTESVEVELELVSPKPRLTDYTIKVVPEGLGSRLAWSATGDAGDDFMGKALGSMQAREKRIGGELEGDLAGLKAVVEARENMQAYRVERSTTIAA